MPLISIIVPIYNKAGYLQRGIQSLLEQSLADIQIILVNDGSTDDSLAICQDFARLDPRILLIDQPNGGVSRARNRGLAAAQGDHIGFMDADDWVEPQMYRSMHSLCLETGSPVCLCDFYFDRDSQVTPVRLDLGKTNLERAAVFQELTLNMLAADPGRSYRKEIKGSVSRLLLNRELLEKHGLGFEPGLIYMEDLLFTVRLLCVADKVCLDPGLWCHFLAHMDSASKSYIPNLFELLLRITASLQRIFQEAGLADEARVRMDHRMVFNGIRAIINEAHANNPKRLSERLREIQRIAAYPPLQAVIPRLDFSNSPPARRRVIRAISKRQALLLYCYFRLKPHYLDPKAQR